MSIWKAIGSYFKTNFEIATTVLGAMTGIPIPTGNLFNSDSQKKTSSQASGQASPVTTQTSTLSSYILPIGLGAAAFYLITKKK
jgi:hypothetical protein